MLSEYGDISTLFTTMGPCLVHLPSIYRSFIHKFSIDAMNLPFSTFKHALLYFISNFERHFEVIFFDIVGDIESFSVPFIDLSKNNNNFEIERDIKKEWFVRNNNGSSSFTKDCLVSLSSFDEFEHSELFLCSFACYLYTFNSIKMYSAQLIPPNTNYYGQINIPETKDFQINDSNKANILKEVNFNNNYSNKDNLLSESNSLSISKNDILSNQSATIIDSVKLIVFDPHSFKTFTSSERISICFVDDLRIRSYLLLNGVYCSSFDRLEFRLPDIYGFIYAPFYVVNRFSDSLIEVFDYSIEHVYEKQIREKITGLKSSYLYDILKLLVNKNEFIQLDSKMDFQSVFVKGKNTPLENVSMNNPSLCTNNSSVYLNNSNTSINNPVVSINNNSNTSLHNSSVYLNNSNTSINNTVVSMNNNSNTSLNNSSVYLNNSNTSINNPVVSLNNNSLSITNSSVYLNNSNTSINNPVVSINNNSNTSLNNSSVYLNNSNTSINNPVVSLNNNSLSITNPHVSINNAVVSINNNSNTSLSISNSVMSYSNSFQKNAPLSHLNWILDDSHIIDFYEIFSNMLYSKLTSTDAKNSRHIRISADSMYSGTLEIKNIKASSSFQKLSKKQQEIINENLQRQQLKQKEIEKVFLRNIIGKYKKETHIGKKGIVNMNLKGYSFDVQIKMLCLKIEFYYECWSLERRKEAADHSVLVSVYVACMEGIEMLSVDSSEKKKETSKSGNLKSKEKNLHTNKAVNKPEASNNHENKTLSYLAEYLDQFLFILNKLVDCGFKSTASEISRLYSIDSPISLESPLPNDNELYFQLKYAGDKLKRTLNSKPDPRVVFTPDGWQRKLLDCVDANKSAVICAPTSSGKTFICFYALEKIVRQSDTDVVIFCLPTKALVNQVMADVYARFSTKNFKNSKTLQGIIMKDYMVEPFNCQVLITVPEMLESLLKTLHKDKVIFNGKKINVRKKKEDKRFNETVGVSIGKDGTIHFVNSLNKCTSTCLCKCDNYENIANDFADADRNKIVNGFSNENHINKYFNDDSITKNCINQFSNDNCINKSVNDYCINKSTNNQSLNKSLNYGSINDDCINKSTNYDSITKNCINEDLHVFGNSNFENPSKASRLIGLNDFTWPIDPKKNSLDKKDRKKEANLFKTPFEIRLEDIKYIIIDEVHKIGSEEMGVAIERIVHLSPCPLLVLSATLGNMERFYTWLKTIENKRNRECELVIHTERFCELKPYVFNYREEVNNAEEDSSDENSSQNENKNLDDQTEKQLPTLTSINPLFAFSYHHIKTSGFCNELRFLPEDLLAIYYTLYECMENKKILRKLSPKKFFTSNIITKNDVCRYEEFIKNMLRKWIQENVIKQSEIKEIYEKLVLNTNKAFNNMHKKDTIVKLINENINRRVGASETITQGLRGIKITTSEVTYKCENNCSDVLSTSSYIYSDASSNVNSDSNSCNLYNENSKIERDSFKNAAKKDHSKDLNDSSYQKSSMKIKCLDHSSFDNNLKKEQGLDSLQKLNKTHASENLDSDSIANLALSNDSNSPLVCLNEEELLCEDISDLCETLKKNDLLPCIIFNMDRHICNEMAKKVFLHLEMKENQEQETKNIEKEREKLLKDLKRQKEDKNRIKKDSWIEESIVEEENIKLLKKEKKNIKFCYLDALTKKSDYELKEICSPIKKTENIYIEMIYRGIGIHHNGMNKKYRHAIENLFRLKHLQVIFSTATLSLGINMPCRSVVFAGNSTELDAINFKQMAGRSGRRGFDTLGNIIFYKMNKNKVQNLLMSGLPEIRGKYDYNFSSIIGYDKTFLKSIQENPLYPLYYARKNQINTDNYKTSQLCATSYNHTTEPTNNKSANLGTTSDNNIMDLNRTSNSNNGHILDKYNLGCFFENIKNREILLKTQLNILDSFKIIKGDKLTTFSNILIRNKENEPANLAFIIILNQIINKNIQITVNEYIELIAHLFEIKYTQKYRTLKKINNIEINSILNGLNKTYIKSMKSLMYNKELNFLQDQCEEALFKIPSFIYTTGFVNSNKTTREIKNNKMNKEKEFKDKINNSHNNDSASHHIVDNIHNSFLQPFTEGKNSYIVDFFDHGKASLIKSQNGITMAELWKSCKIVETLLISVSEIFEIFKVDSEFKKIAKQAIQTFQNKFNRLHA